MCTTRFIFKEKPEEPNLNPQRSIDLTLSSIREEFHDLDTEISTKEKVRQAMIEFAKSSGMKFYLCGHEVSLEDVDINSIKNWCFGNTRNQELFSGGSQKNSADFLELSQLVGQYFEGKRFLGMYASFDSRTENGLDAGEGYTLKGIESTFTKIKDELGFLPFEYYRAPQFLKDLSFIKKIVNWNDKEVQYPSNVEMESKLRLIDTYHTNSRNEGHFSKQVQEEFFRRVFLRNEGIFKAREMHPKYDIALIYGADNHLKDDPRIMDWEGTLVCTPKATSDRQKLEEQTKSNYDEAVEEIQESINLNDYEQWKKKWIKRNGDPFQD